MAKAEHNWTGWRNILPKIETTIRPPTANDDGEVRPKFEDIQRIGHRIEELEEQLSTIQGDTLEGRRKYVEFERMQSKRWDETVQDLSQVYGTAADIFKQICPSGNVTFPEHTKPDPPTLPDTSAVDVDLAITQIRENFKNE